LNFLYLLLSFKTCLLSLIQLIISIVFWLTFKHLGCHRSEQDLSVSLSHWLVCAAIFISWAREASPSINSRSLLLKLASRRLDVARGASSCVCVCVLPGEFVLSQSFVNLHSKWFSPPWWLIEWGKRLSRHPWSLWAPQRRRSSLCGSELREQILCLLFLLFISHYSWLWAHFIPIYFCGLFRCGKSLVGYFRTYWLTFDSNTFFRFQFLYSCRNFLHKCRKFRSS
jgi:hypothetical protein